MEVGLIVVVVVFWGRKEFAFGKGAGPVAARREEISTGVEYFRGRWYIGGEDGAFVTSLVWTYHSGWTFRALGSVASRC